MFWDDIKEHYGENVGISAWADVTGSIRNGTLEIAWTTDIGIEGHGALTRPTDDQRSELSASAKNWHDNKEYVAGLEGRNYLFRGQTSRGDCELRFIVPVGQTYRDSLGRIFANCTGLSVQRQSTSSIWQKETKRRLLQPNPTSRHPTPILDWTYSPYVAAFFAYRGISNKRLLPRPRRIR